MFFPMAVRWELLIISLTSLNLKNTKQGTNIYNRAYGLKPIGNYNYQR